jgi:hypothetical protein
MSEPVESAVPSLEAFDQEFARAPDQQPPRRRRILRLSTMVAFVLGGGIVGALALAWPETVGLLRAELPPPLVASLPLPRDPAEQQNEQLLAELETLKHEVRELTVAQHEAATTIAGLKAEQQSKNRTAPAGWYSESAALNFPVTSRSSANAAPQRSAVARPRPAPPPRRETPATTPTDPD